MTQRVYGTRGTVLVCLKGSVDLVHAIPNEGAVTPYVVPSPLHQGESYLFEDAHSISLRSACLAQLLCLRPQAMWRVLLRTLMQRVKYYAMITFIRRGVEQSGSSSGS